MAKILKRDIDNDVSAPRTRVSISTPVADTRPYLTRHLPNSYRRRLSQLANYYEVSLEEMLNCSVGHGLSALEMLKTVAEAKALEEAAESEVENEQHS